MPVLTVNGEKKKVACGPCIRGHRSSKCAHKDRVLIEVRKPGRPLGTCPHPAGSCGCERVVINYMIPRERSNPMMSPGLPSNLQPASRVQKKSQRSVANLNQTAVQKVISGDPDALAQLARFPTESFPHASDDSSEPPSTASSSSSTPRIDAIHTPQSSVYSENASQPGNDHRWQGGWTGYDGGLQSAQGPGQPIQPPQQQEPSSCCCPEPKESPTPRVAEAPQTPGHPMYQIPSSTHPQPFPHAHQFQSAPLAHQGYATQSGAPFTQPDFPSFEFDIGCGGMHLPSDSIQERIMAGGHSDCGCGDTCECFACMTHPNNNTTIKYVKYHQEILTRPAYLPEGFPPPATQFSSVNRVDYSLPFQYDPTHPPPAVLQSFPHNFGNHFAGQVPVGFAVPAWPTTAGPSVQIPHTPVTEMEGMHFGPVHSQLDPSMHAVTGIPSYLKHEPIARPQNGPSTAEERKDPNGKTRITSPLMTAAFDAESPADDDSSTLSPSSFLVQQFTLPGCDDITGTCQCGEGCKCSGCVTHSGHRSNEGGGETEDEFNNFLLDPAKEDLPSCCR
ncbi:hypothetical protein BT63DRAFT_454777 [Microthyrium microscopicum]|uniref:Copper-fist domain-containing protein n=1 Tax=Microthyrium microscopicum TaxID=703497 RepID=A0A6A6UFL2_9PEZI|nr:hypothetical protein BT63DRAFT_454777 [Microthyrium microscopicum]